MSTTEKEVAENALKEIIGKSLNENEMWDLYMRTKILQRQYFDDPATLTFAQMIEKFPWLEMVSLQSI